jgi:hypothetical protein
MTTLTTFTTLSDADLLAEVTRIATCERHATAQFVASLAELDARRLYLGRGFSSMFTYCIQALHLSEHAAYNRIEAARIARRFPTIPRSSRRRVDHSHDGLPARGPSDT